MSIVKKTKIALDESRMLMLGAQILLGFQLQAPFQNAFTTLSTAERYLALIVLGLLVLVVGLIVVPSARHRIVEDGNATPSINRFITRSAVAALVIFALALGLDLAVAATRIAGAGAGALAACLGSILALGFWCGPYLIAKEHREPVMAKPVEATPTSAKIEYVLTEARVVLPGAQALLGFQLAIVLTTGFAELAYSAKLTHGAALGLVTLATVLLIAPAAYHRIVYGGAEVPEFYRVASRLLLCASLFLALGLAFDIDVVMEKITESSLAAHAGAASAAVLLLGLWHGWPAWVRYRKGALAEQTTAQTA